MGRSLLSEGTPGRLLGWGWQGLFFAALCLVAVVFTAVVAPTSGAYFERFYGAAPPLVVVLAAGAVGAVALRVLARFGFAVILGRRTLQGVRLSAVLASILAVAVVIADLLLRYPADLNVPLPEALLFYPAIGLTAEVVFHLLPLALLLLVLGAVVPRGGRERGTWFALALVAMLEPLFQVFVGGGGAGPVDVYTWFHVFVLAALQLYVFRRFDFASMYAFRLIYYVYWHILWGTIRIPLLF